MKTTTIIPENETKAEKFIRIATPRVNSVIDKRTSSPTAPVLPMSTTKSRLNPCLTQSATPLTLVTPSSSRNRKPKKSVSLSDCFT